MPHWFLPLLALIGLGAFFYFGFWRGLSNQRDPDNRDSGDASAARDLLGSGHSGGDASGHH
ncbi:hypothetical protein JQ557_29905 [Bradyrhizobium sp. U87765 SZCCT0131]|uniref:hypothetical protein n=1 Tax=unclassified Bradyrhizobium TaxID=2631580 RepID=UPI001BA5B2F4|nr:MULTISPECIES: hypothetical protein [unclassified Bradyrhizobium]MBR1222250.1 hypothetical protein [Bradyrhizobium sp. U87765 SZCCT0131]MBR1264266.1 hypothetical protein [Bradyrhizobium sp. U87765 SZCCT0134]MBR1307951.1 hypothetical protein [Bradyrhizobium sp. U87765 SZCCT0110]MBR1320516.1 hypothetical protein [Bradyrhizobium sp. U87765 SZCCT0109]MBR1348371.1 hypothetical protein [Bradyrhizobium sp. U87765 SZCCT0048]